MKPVWVPLKGNPYPIYIGKGILSRLPSLMSRHGLTGRAVVVTDLFLRRSWGETALSSLRQAGWKASLKTLPRGERAKSFKTLEEIYSFLLKTGAERRTALVAIGGGSVGDSAGFAAATYYRGIPLVHVPTTLLAQVDSAIGGKTAVNHGLAKNVVGAFHQPRLVLADIEALRTLPKRELLSGLSEVVKYGLAFDPNFAYWLQGSWGKILNHNSNALLKIVQASALWKARVVAQDERDMGGRRQFLNFGHTLGHALESATNFEFFTHGEAVAWGMRTAIALSEKRGWLNKKDIELADSLLGKLTKPVLPKNIRWSKVLCALRHDKKSRDSKIIFILLRGLGHPIEADDVTNSELALAAARAGLNF